MKKFSTKEAIRFGWETFKKNWQFLFVVGLVPILIDLASWLSQKSGKELSGFVWPGFIWLVSVFVSIGVVKIYLILGSGAKPKLSELYANYRYFPSYLLGSFLYFFIVIFGLFLLIVPGVIFSIRLGFWKYALVDKNLSALESLKLSWKITKGQAINLLGFNIVRSLINLLGILALGIGILVSGPVTILTEVFVYRKLSNFGDLEKV